MKEYVVDAGIKNMVYLINFNNSTYGLSFSTNARVNSAKSINRLKADIPCTVVAVDNENNVYGVILNQDLAFTEGGLVITWFKEKELEHYLGYKIEECVDKDSLAELNIDECGSSEHGTHNNILCIGSEQTFDVKYVTVSCTSEHKLKLDYIDKHCFLSKNCFNANSKDIRELLRYALDTINREQAEIVQLKQDLSEKCKRLSTILETHSIETNDSESEAKNESKSEGKSNNKTILEVLDIYTIDSAETKQHITTPSDIMSEAVLKYLSVGDSVTIPYEYFCKLRVVMQGMLESNQKQTIFKALVTLKFDADSESDMFVLVDCDSETQHVVIEVLKAYNPYKVSDMEIAKYKLSYNKISRMRLTT